MLDAIGSSEYRHLCEKPMRDPMNIDATIRRLAEKGITHSQLLEFLKTMDGVTEAGKRRAFRLLDTINAERDAEVLRRAQPATRATYWDRFDALVAAAEASPNGRALLAAGFEAWYAGGGCHAWRKVGPGYHVLLTWGDSEFGTGADPSDGDWNVGVYDDTGDDWSDTVAGRLAEAIAEAEKMLTDPHAYYRTRA